ncbi:MAG: PepSY-associated TM helix domain-containing protein [Aliarcobacter sp.]|jgi:sulfite reductase (NADPH) flavoprotein alpha-component|nr:PepSY-associated TM helix domain-containing protein [Aliarcobacter sp.]
MYKNIWFKLHLILGLSAGFILLIVGFTGAMLSFEKEILSAINQDTYKVTVFDKAKLSTKELLEKFQEQKPQSKINGITISSFEDDSVSINVAGEGENARKGVTYYVNPYTAEILPELKGVSFFKTVENIHRRLLLDDLGKQVVALSVVSLLVLIFSGIYVYFPRLKKSFLQSLKLNFQSKGRFFLANLHSAIGMWVIPFYLVFCLTGLYWSYDFVSNGLHTITGVEKPKKPQMQGSQGEKISFDDISLAVDTFKNLVENKYSSATLRFPQKGSVYSFDYLAVDVPHERAKNKIEFDIKTNQVSKHEKYEDKTLTQKLMGSILPLHTGEYFGVLGQTLMFLASLMMPLFAITGLMLYVKRTKKKKSA